MVGFGGRRRKDIMEDKEAVAVTKAKEENTEVSPTMDEMEEENAASFRCFAVKPPPFKSAAE